MNEPKVQLIGIPFDGKSTYLRGTSNGPNRIREEISSDAYNPYSEDMKKVLGGEVISDQGNTVSLSFDHIYDEVRELLDPSMKPIFLGGDHSISFPLVRTMFKQHGPLHIIHFDAHGDLYADYFGDLYSHACPFARILENGYPASLTQIGIRAMTPYQVEVAEKYNVNIFSMDRVNEVDLSIINSPVYISLDLDVIDPAFAPGVSHRESGGMTPRDVIDMLHQVKANVIGADLVEFNPLNDSAEITAALCAKLLKELVGVMI